MGCEVLLASNGAEALARIRKRAPDVLITDLNMPGLDGWALVNMCRNEPNLKQMPIVVVMKAESNATAQSLAALGVQKVVARPFDVHVMQAELQASLAPSCEAIPCP
jgi:CheY-like chemotaxis protein